MLAKIVEHLLAGPMHGVAAGVDYEPDSTPGIGFKASIIGPRILIETDLLAKAFGIKCPAFGVGGVFKVAAEGGKSVKFLCDGNLQVMAGNAFVITDGLHVRQRALIELVEVDVDRARALAVGAAF